MQYDEFVGQVQHRARLASTGEAVRAIHATLLTLGERLIDNEAHDLSSQLPQEIGAYLREACIHDSFSLNDFYARVAAREQREYPDAVYHAKAVISVLCEAVSGGEIADMRAELPPEYNALFTWEGEDGLRKSA